MRENTVSNSVKALTAALLLTGANGNGKDVSNPLPRQPDPLLRLQQTPTDFQSLVAPSRHVTVADVPRNVNVRAEIPWGQRPAPAREIGLGLLALGTLGTSVLLHRHLNAQRKLVDVCGQEVERFSEAVTSLRFSNYDLTVRGIALGELAQKIEAKWDHAKHLTGSRQAKEMALILGVIRESYEEMLYSCEVPSRETWKLCSILPESLAIISTWANARHIMSITPVPIAVVGGILYAFSNFGGLCGGGVAAITCGAIGGLWSESPHSIKSFFWGGHALNSYFEQLIDD